MKSRLVFAVCAFCLALLCIASIGASSQPMALLSPEKLEQIEGAILIVCPIYTDCTPVACQSQVAMGGWCGQFAAWDTGICMGACMDYCASTDSEGKCVLIKWEGGDDCENDASCNDACTGGTEWTSSTSCLGFTPNCGCTYTATGTC